MASNMITLNVGGTIYTTSIQTLTRYPDSMLGTMFGTQSENSGSRLDPSNKDEHGRFVIDRDGPMFRYVLNFLRESSLTLPKDFKELDLLKREAEFYQIEPLIEAAGKAVDMVEPKSSCQMEWVKAVQSVADNSWTIFGKQESLDKIKDQFTKYRVDPYYYTMQFVPRDISITVKVVDVVLESVLRYIPDKSLAMPNEIWEPLKLLGFVKFYDTSYDNSYHVMFVHRAYPDK